MIRLLFNNLHGVCQVHGEVVCILAQRADQHLKHEEQATLEQALAAKTGTSYAVPEHSQLLCELPTTHMEHTPSTALTIHCI